LLQFCQKCRKKRRECGNVDKIVAKVDKIVAKEVKLWQNSPWNNNNNIYLQGAFFIAWSKDH
jgi:hypothetical protein